MFIIPRFRLLSRANRLINLRAVIQVQPDMIGGNHFYRMHKLPDHFFIPLMYMVILLIQRSLCRMRTLLRFLVIAELGGDTAVISVGYNSYGHPAEETLERLALYGYNVYRTDRDGTVEIRIG